MLPRRGYCRPKCGVSPKLFVLRLCFWCPAGVALGKPQPQIPCHGHREKSNVSHGHDSMSCDVTRVKIQQTKRIHRELETCACVGLGDGNSQCLCMSTCDRHECLSPVASTRPDYSKIIIRRCSVRARHLCWRPRTS